MAFLQNFNQSSIITSSLSIADRFTSVPTSSERATRSVFVGNIPYDATDDQLKEIFNQVGHVASFRMVYDRDTGKPKGYGFCEYADQETAQSAMRNLNNFDFNGRTLRVGYASGESKEDGKSLQPMPGGVPVESPFGDTVDQEKAPEAISKAVASLPPEQMFELMKQMKLCIQNNPNEARNMLLQNPQLAYALLQAQIVMKIVDPQVAMAMLYRDDSQDLASIAQPMPPPVVPSLSRATQPLVTPGQVPATAPATFQSATALPPPQAVHMQIRPLISQPDCPQNVSHRSQQQASSNHVAGELDHPISAQDQEKASLIIQVLQLTDQQIAMLPPEQRQSIMILKEQLAKNQ